MGFFDCLYYIWNCMTLGMTGYGQKKINFCINLQRVVLHNIVKGHSILRVYFVTYHTVLEWLYNNIDKKWKDDFTNQTGGGSI